MIYQLTDLLMMMPDLTGLLTHLHIYIMTSSFEPMFGKRLKVFLSVSGIQVHHGDGLPPA